MVYKDATTDMVFGTDTSHTFNFMTGGTVRARFTSTGHFEPKDDDTYDLGGAGNRWANIYSADLQLSNIGTGGNEVDGTEGKWTMQEGADSMYLINRLTGKKFKIAMTEVS